LSSQNFRKFMKIKNKIPRVLVLNMKPYKKKLVILLFLIDLRWKKAKV